MSEGGKRRREEKQEEWKSKAEEDEEERREMLGRRLRLMAWGAEEELRKRERIRMEREDMAAKWRELSEAAGGAEASALEWQVLPREEEGDSEEPPPSPVLSAPESPLPDRGPGF